VLPSLRGGGEMIFGFVVLSMFMVCFLLLRTYKTAQVLEAGYSNTSNVRELKMEIKRIYEMD